MLPDENKAGNRPRDFQHCRVPVIKLEREGEHTACWQ